LFRFILVCPENIYANRYRFYIRRIIDRLKNAVKQEIITIFILITDRYLLSRQHGLSRRFPTLWRALLIFNYKSTKN